MSRSAGNIFDKSRVIQLAHEGDPSSGDAAIGEVNVRELRGRAVVIASAEGVGGGSPTFDIAIQSALLTGGSFTNFVTFTQIIADDFQSIVMDMDQAGPFIKCVFTVAGSSPVGEFFVGLIAGANVLPTDES